VTAPNPANEALLRDVRLFVLGQAARTTRIPEPREIAAALRRPEPEIRDGLGQLALGRVIVLAPNSGNIWIASPFCAVPSQFRVETGGKTYSGICIWDALGILAALGSDGVVRAGCGDCGEPLDLEVTGGRLTRSEGIIHFAVPALRWWDNIGFT
jgi:alkylmercury lyase-like protein